MVYYTSTMNTFEKTKNRIVKFICDILQKNNMIHAIIFHVIYPLIIVDCFVVYIVFLTLAHFLLSPKKKYNKSFQLNTAFSFMSIAPERAYALCTI